MRAIWEVMESDWPNLSGKRFVLYAAVKGEAGYHGFWPMHFYSPEWDGEYAPWPEYEALDIRSLKTQEVGHLTSFAGRRNQDPRYHLAPGTGGRGDPILADAAFDDWVIVLFANGRAKRYPRSRMVGRDGRLVFGDGATHPVLRALSLD